MTGGIRYLDLEDLLGLVRLLRAGPVRDMGLLDSAALRPRSSAFGEDAYPTLALKAARCCTAWPGTWSPTATSALPDSRRRRSDVDDDAAFGLVMTVATRDLGVAAIAERLGVVLLAKG